MGKSVKKLSFFFAIIVVVTFLMCCPVSAQRTEPNPAYTFAKSEFDQMSRRRSRYLSIRRSCRPRAEDLQDKVQSGETKPIVIESAQALLKCYRQAMSARAELYPLVRILSILGQDESVLIDKGWTLPQIIELIEWNKETDKALLEIKEQETIFPTNSQIHDLLKQAGQKPILIAGLPRRFSFITKNSPLGTEF